MDYTYTPIFELPKIEAEPVVEKTIKEVDENTPKSTPEYENSFYE